MVAGNIQTGGIDNELMNQRPAPSITVGGGGDIGLVASSLSCQVFSAANAPNPGALSVDSVLASYQLPPNTFDGITIMGLQSFRGIRVRAGGYFANVSDTTQVKLFFNPTTAIVGSTVGAGGTAIVVGNSSNHQNSQFYLDAQVYKIGGPGSNTQCTHSLPSIQGAGVICVPSLPSFPTALESGPINVCCTGNAASNLTDILLTFFEVIGFN